MEREGQRKGWEERKDRRWRGKDSGRDGKRGKTGRGWRGKEGGGEEEGLTQGVVRSVGSEAKRLAGGGGGGGDVPGARC